MVLQVRSNEKEITFLASGCCMINSTKQMVTVNVNMTAEIIICWYSTNLLVHLRRKRYHKTV